MNNQINNQQMELARNKAVQIIEKVEEKLQDPNRKGKPYDLVDPYIIQDKDVKKHVDLLCIEKGIIREDPNTSKGIYGWYFSKGNTYELKHEAVSKPSNGREKSIRMGIHRKNRLH